MALGALKTALLGEGESDFNCDLFYGDDVSGTEIVTCASEVAVFAARRVVVVKAADKLPARECDAILPYLKEPNGSTAVIFVAPKLDGRLKFTQALARAAVMVDCSPLRAAQCLGLRQDAERVGSGSTGAIEAQELWWLAVIVRRDWKAGCVCLAHKNVTAGVCEVCANGPGDSC